MSNFLSRYAFNYAVNRYYQGQKAFRGNCDRIRPNILDRPSGPAGESEYAHDPCLGAALWRGGTDPIAGGTRRYTEAHLRRLQLLGAAVAAGHRISDIVSLDDMALAGLGGAVKTEKAQRPVTNRGSNIVALDPRAVTEAIDLARDLDARGVEQILGLQYRLLGPSAFRNHFCRVLLTRVGGLWEKGELSLAAEHLLSAALKKPSAQNFRRSVTGCQRTKSYFHDAR